MISHLFTSKCKNEIDNFVISTPEILMNYISANYPLDFNSIKQLQNLLIWDSRESGIDFDDDFGPRICPEIVGISDNTSINWSIELLDYFKDKWNWKHLSKNVSLNWWSETLLECFEDKWDWLELSDNQNLRLSKDLIERFKSSWNWKSSNYFNEFQKWNRNKPVIKGICGNNSIVWGFDKIERFYDLIDWPALSLNSNIKWRDNRSSKCVKGKYVWGEFGLLNNLLASFSQWDIENLSYNSSLGNNLTGESDRAIIEFLNSYDWDWKGISQNPSIPWSDKIISFFENRIDWAAFSKKLVFNNTSNSYLSWTKYFIDKYHDKLNWDLLSSNPALPWSLNFITSYESLWNFEKLSYNKGITWTNKMLTKYENKLNWEYLSEYSNIGWDNKLINKFQRKLDLKKLSHNKKVKWDLSLIRKYENKIDLSDIFKQELETPLPWVVYKFMFRKYPVFMNNLLSEYPFCKNILNRIIHDDNFDAVFKRHLEKNCSLYYNPVLEYELFARK